MLGAKRTELAPTAFIGGELFSPVSTPCEGFDRQVSTLSRIEPHSLCSGTGDAQSGLQTKRMDLDLSCVDPRKNHNQDNGNTVAGFLSTTTG